MQLFAKEQKKELEWNIKSWNDEPMNGTFPGW